MTPVNLRRAVSALVLACVVLVGGLGLLAGTAAASSNAAGTSPTGTGGSALSPSGNDECFACHGQKPVDGTITVDGQKVPAYIDVNGEQKSIYVDRHIQANSRHGQLACISCHIGFNAGMHPESVTQGWLKTAKITACGDCHGEEDKMYEQLVPREPGAHQGRRQGARSAPTATTRTTSSRRAPRRSASSPWPCAPSATADAKTTYLDSYHGKAFVLGNAKTAVCCDCHGGHRILPASDPASTVSEQNVVKTCARCHPGANENFADFKVHVNPQDPRSSFADLVLLDRLRPAHRRRVQLRRSCTPACTSTAAGRKACTRAAHHPGRARRGSHAHRVPPLQRVPPLDALPRHRQLHGARVHRHAAQVQGHRTGRSGSWTCSAASPRPASTTGSRRSSPSSTGPAEMIFMIAMVAPPPRQEPARPGLHDVRA